MTLRRIAQSAAVAGVLVSLGLLVADANPIEERLPIEVIFGIALVTAVVIAPFVVAFKLLDRQPVQQWRCWLFLVAIVAGIVTAFIVRPDPTSPNGADGLQILAASFDQASFVIAAAAVSDFANARARRRSPLDQVR